MAGIDLNFIRCGEIEIATSCEDNEGNLVEAYSPCNILFYMQSGQMNIEIDGNEYLIPKNHFGFLRKHTQCKFFKSWDNSDGSAKTYSFLLTNEYIRKVIERVSLPRCAQKTTTRYLPIPTTQPLKSVMNSLIDHVDNGNDLDPDLVEQKTLEALEALLRANKDAASVLQEFSFPEKADLEKLIYHNYLYNIPLKELASRSGRSLSSFNRDFRVIFNDTPHRWIMNKRLEYARDLMAYHKKRPSEVFLISGFEDLAHFSRSYKKKFRITPSQFFKEWT